MGQNPTSVIEPKFPNNHIGAPHFIFDLTSSIEVNK